MNTDYLSLTSASRELGISRRTLQRWIASEHIKKNSDGFVSRRAIQGVIAGRTGASRSGPGRPILGTYGLKCEVRARPFCTPSGNGLRSLREMLERVASFYLERGRIEALHDALLNSVAGMPLSRRHKLHDRKAFQEKMNNLAANLSKASQTRNQGSDQR